MRRYNRNIQKVEIEIEVEDFLLGLSEEVEDFLLGLSEETETEKGFDPCTWLKSELPWERLPAREFGKVVVHARECTIPGKYEDVETHSDYSGTFREVEVAERGRQSGALGRRTFGWHEWDPNRVFGTQLNSRRMREEGFAYIEGVQNFLLFDLSEKEVFRLLRSWKSSCIWWDEEDHEEHWDDWKIDIFNTIIKELHQLSGLRIPPRVSLDVASLAILCRLQKVDDKLIQKQLDQRDAIRAEGILRKELHKAREKRRARKPLFHEEEREGIRFLAASEPQEYQQLGREFDCCVGYKDPTKENVIAMWDNDVPVAILTASDGEILEVRGISNSATKRGGEIKEWALKIGVIDDIDEGQDLLAERLNEY